MNPTPNYYSSKDEKESSPLEGTQSSPAIGKKPRPIAIGVISVIKGVATIIFGATTISALTGATPASGYPWWFFIYAYILIALGIGYLAALVLILRYKRLGLILMAVFVGTELSVNAVLFISNQGQINLLGLSISLLLLSAVIRFLTSEPQKEFFT